MQAKILRREIQFSSIDVEKWNLYFYDPVSRDDARRGPVPNKEKHWSIVFCNRVEGCEGHNGAMLVVTERTGNDSAKGLYDALMKKFNIKHTALLPQMELARFNGIDYNNRILEAKMELVQYGYKDL